MADGIDCTIQRPDMQMVEIAPDPPEGVRGEAGAMLYMEDGIDMQTAWAPDEPGSARSWA